MNAMFGNAVQAKLASMVLIGAGSFVVGIAPACFVSRARHLQRKLLLSCALCFGAGVLLATATLHVLPEVRHGLPDYAELVFSCGYLLLYLVEEGVHYFCRGGRHGPETAAAETDSRSSRLTDSRIARERGWLYELSESLPWCRLQRHRAKQQGLHVRGRREATAQLSTKSSCYGTTRCIACDCHSRSLSEENTFLCHGNHGEQCTDANTGLAGLALALTVHAVLEGLAIGLQTKIAEVLLLTGAVASHKFVVGFCLGLELAGVSKSVPRLVFAIFLFAIGSVIGIGIGMLTFQVDTDWSKVALPILQGLAGGTLLYVTVSEVLPRERTRWHKSSRRFAGILQFLAVVVGFAVIFLLNTYMGE
ncbi:zinc transporter ZIP3 isoform X2 [Temnothorax longispinosus]|uniref:zinc transporter ZIP3 isoform X2 n=1 Tax=Temnothorax longispinosus TaxID=300112 RepID=UPI003A98D98F